MKTCKMCKLVKDLNEFYNAKNLKDGKRNKCKDCMNYLCKIQDKLKENERKQYRKDYYKENAEKIKRKSRKWRHENHDKYKEDQKRRYLILTEEEKKKKNEKSNEYRKSEKGKAYNKKYRTGKKWVARYSLHNAIRSGKIEKGKECMLCGSDRSIEAHHKDYDKPLEVIWLCKSCHIALHKRLKER